MKTTLIPVQVPDWAKWVAQDEDGEWYAYEREPHPSDGGWLHHSGYYVYRCTCKPNPNWRETLREVE